MESFNIRNLNPVQEMAIKSGLLDKKSLIISSPTASGKTLCAALIGMKLFYENKKMLYLCPLVALAQEKYQEFKEKFSKFGLKISISIGNLDSNDPFLKNYDWIIASNEKIDSLIRHGAEWIKDVGAIVVDEIHLLTDPSRGPTLEILLTRLKETIPNATILGLSATIKNVKELAEWFKASPVVTDWRPVKLYEGICYNSNINFLNWKSYELDHNFSLEESIIKNTLDLKKQCIFFTATKKNAESLAEKLTKTCSIFLTDEEKQNLEKISDQILNFLDTPTKQCQRLTKCLRYGVAFHHAGLLGKQKTIIENEFRKGNIKVIAATPTLAMGINLPSFRIIIRDTKRYYSGYGSMYIPVMDYKQMCGRAGRPQYNEHGEAILIAKSSFESQEFLDRYILAESEEIQSKLALEPVLRTQTLALIASDFVNTRKSLFEFFQKTFYSHQFGDISLLEKNLIRIIETLKDFGFLVENEDKLSATKIGKRISELYIDPLTGHHFIKCLVRSNNMKSIPFSYLHMIANTLEIKPLFSVNSRDFEELEKSVLQKQSFLTETPEEWDDEYEDFIKTVKFAIILNNWINEMHEDVMLEKYNITPGELRTKLMNVDWLLYSVHELALLLGYKDTLKDLKKLRVRIKYGVKEELLPLVRLEDIGRIRARKLWSNNLKSLEDLRKISLDVLQKIIGKNIALEIKKQLGEKKDVNETLVNF